MLRHGLSSYDFSRIANIAFVRAAGDILREQGKPMSFSRVSAITGLHRHVVSDIVNSPRALADPKLDRQGLSPQSTGPGPDRLVRKSALHGQRRPSAGPGAGRPEPSFASLVRAFSGDIYPRIILDELRGGRRGHAPEGRQRSRAHPSLLRGGAEPAAIQHLGNVARDVFSTLEHNLARPPEAAALRRHGRLGPARSRGTAAVPATTAPARRRVPRGRRGLGVGARKADSPDAVRAGVIVQMFVDEDAEEAEEPVGSDIR